MIKHLQTSTFHTNLYNLVLLGSIFISLTFTLLLWFVKTNDRAANRFLALTLTVVILWLLRALGIDIPLQCSLTLGPLIYFYSVKITIPEYKFRWKGLLLFSPLLLWNFSVIIYLYLAHRLIEQFYQRQKFSRGERHRHELRWLDHQLVGFGFLWLLWISGMDIMLAVMTVWISSSAFLRRDTEPMGRELSGELRQKAIWLKKTVKANLYYQDPELTLGSLAEKLDMNSHELSRIINKDLKKNFNDFINEYRVAEIIKKMQDRSNDRMTLLGIAFESGFNSKTTFNRTFKQMTSKTPMEYKNDLKKERPSYNLERQAGPTAVISHRKPTQWTHDHSNRQFMFRNYVKIAWRNMVHNKVYSALNIAGLAAGMAVALLIGLWIYSQYSYDRFLPGYDQLYQVKLNFYHSSGIQTQNGSALPLVEEIRRNYPEVKYASETDWGGQNSLVVADKKLDPNGLTVGTDFLKMFQFPLLRGDVNTVFREPNSIVLTESVAKALFGQQDPMDKSIRINNKNNVVVTGIMKDLPANSTLQFSYLLPYSYLEQTYPETKKERTDWGNYSNPEYVELQPGVDGEAFENKIKNIIAKHGATEKIEVVLQPAKNWRLLTVFINGKASDGFIQYVRIFGIIGILVLVIACINFINLSTARAEKRAREVGVRKSIGSSRKDLIIQFLSESLMITFAAFIVSVAIVQLSLPGFNILTGSTISIPYTNFIFWVIMLGYILITGLLAGSRPAFYLSSFNPVSVLKGTIQLGKGAMLPRKILVSLQFTCSIALIICTLIIYQQIKYAKDRPKGYNADGLLLVNNSNDLDKNYTALKHDLLQSSQVESVTKAGSGMFYFPASFSILDWPGKKKGESMEMNTNAISPDYIRTVGMTLKSGHEFAAGADPDTLNIILNEAAAQKLRLKDPLNQMINFGYSGKPMRVIGVVNNAIIGSPFYAASPAIYVYNPGWAGAIMLRLAPDADRQQAIKKISAIFDRYNPSFPFDYSFADEAYNATFQLEKLVGTLAGIFAGLAVFISCLGLFGLAAYIAEQRKKEIGIRKVLGASVSQVWILLSGDFILLVGISCVIASPLAFYFLYGWLQNFDYRITMGPYAFVEAAALTIIITILTVSYQAISSALTNPVKSLRAE